MVEGMCGKGGMHGKGACVGGACMVGGMHGGGMHGGGHAWQGGRACMAGEMATAGGMCGRRDGHCSERYASYWNAYL